MNRSRSDGRFVRTAREAAISFITGEGIASTVHGSDAEFDSADSTYTRVEVSDDSGERLFFQPVIW